MADTGEILLNIEVPKDAEVGGSNKKSSYQRKMEFEQRRRMRKKKPPPRSAEGPVSVQSSDKPRRNAKGAAEETSGFVSKVMGGEVLPNFHSGEGKYVFDSLKELSSSKRVSWEKQGPGKIDNATNNRKFSLEGKSRKFPGKSKDAQSDRDAPKATSGEGFASFVEKPKKSSDSSNVEKTVSGSAGKFIKKANKTAVPKKSDQTKSAEPFSVLATNKAGDSMPGSIRKQKNVREVEDFDFDALMESEARSTTQHVQSFDFDSSSDSDRERGKGRTKAKKPKQWTVIGTAEEGEKKHREEGKISSLFANNPEIPKVAQRVVKPVHETVFSKNTFDSLNIHKFQVSNLASMGVTTLTTVQRKAVPPMLEGRDMLVRSQTGSGKTLAYAVPLVELLQRQQPPLTRADGIRALVILPTRELALQTYEWFLKLVKPFLRLVPGCIVGGEKRKSEKARLRKGITILVGTPGRILDHVKHTCSVRLDKVQYLVLDEADCMSLDVAYERDVASILESMESQSGPVLSKEALEWNRSTYGVNKKSQDDEDIEKDTSRPNKVTKFDVYEEEEVARKESTEESSDEEEVEEEKGRKKSEEPPRLEVVERDRSEDECSDYDPEILADIAVVRKKKTKVRTRASDTEDSEDSYEQSEDEEAEEEEPLEKEEEVEAAPKKQPGKWQTVMLSATLTPIVQRLAGLALRSPVFVDAAHEGDVEDVADVSPEAPEVSVPDSLVQSYVVVPAKLRLVTLSAFIAWKCKYTEERKMLLFCATLDMVDYLCELLTVGLSKPDEDDYDSEDEQESNLKVDIDFFRLHGDMDQKERTHVFRTFRAAKCGVLLCTDVAARGIDLPHVDWIVQFTVPGNVPDYVHRIGRTARVGAVGNALIFLLPAEVEFVALLQDKRMRLQEESFGKFLQKLAQKSGTLTKYQNSNLMEAVATELQLRYEQAVLDRSSLHDMALKAYVSYVRFYASYPLHVRNVCCFKELHLGHVAKSFALRDPPSKISSLGRSKFHDKAKRGGKDGNKRARGWRHVSGPGMEKGRGRGRGRGGARGGRIGTRVFAMPPHKRQNELLMSEFASGLEPSKKRGKRME